MTRVQIQRIGNPHFALLCAMIEQCHRDIADFKIMYARCQKLPNITEQQNHDLVELARASVSAKDFLPNLPIRG